MVLPQLSNSELVNFSAKVVIFLAILFAFTKVVGGIPFSVDSIITNKSDVFNVSGEGKVAIKPDLAIVSLGVSQQGQDARAVAQQLDRVIAQVIEVVKEQGVNEQDIQTTNYSINPVYEQNEPIVEPKLPSPKTSPTTIRNYVGDNTVSIKVRKIDQVDAIIDAAVASGANQVNQITFDAQDRSQAENQARREAVEEAKKKASDAAQSAGFKLGKMINYYESFDGPIYGGLGGGGGMATDVRMEPITTIEPGSTEVRVTVTLSYEIR